MPNDGTVQDSRNPYSPQWGYLMLAENENNFTLDNYAFRERFEYAVSYTGTGSSKPKWPPMFDAAWNKYIMFFHNIKRKRKTRRLLGGTKVKFEMRKAEITLLDSDNVPGKKQRIWVAEVVEIR